MDHQTTNGLRGQRGKFTGGGLISLADFLHFPFTYCSFPTTINTRVDNNLVFFQILCDVFKFMAAFINTQYTKREIFIYGGARVVLHNLCSNVVLNFKKIAQRE